MNTWIQNMYIATEAAYYFVRKYAAVCVFQDTRGFCLISGTSFINVVMTQCC